MQVCLATGSPQPRASRHGITSLDKPPNIKECELLMLQGGPGWQVTISNNYVYISMQKLQSKSTNITFFLSVVSYVSYTRKLPHLQKITFNLNFHVMEKVNISYSAVFCTQNSKS